MINFNDTYVTKMSFKYKFFQLYFTHFHKTVAGRQSREACQRGWRWCGASVRRVGWALPPGGEHLRRRADDADDLLVGQVHWVPPQR